MSAQASPKSAVRRDLGDACPGRRSAAQPPAVSGSPREPPSIKFELVSDNGVEGYRAPAPADAVEARPWREGEGPKPVTWSWPPTDPPALWVRVRGSWARAWVSARLDWPDGRRSYQVLIDAAGSTALSHRTYDWPQSGLRVAQRSTAEPSREAGLGGGLPTPPKRHVRSARTTAAPDRAGNNGEQR